MNKAKIHEIIEKVQNLDKIEQATVYGMIKGIEAAKSIKLTKNKKMKVESCQNQLSNNSK